MPREGGLYPGNLCDVPGAFTFSGGSCVAWALATLAARLVASRLLVFGMGLYDYSLLYTFLSCYNNPLAHLGQGGRKRDNEFLWIKMWIILGIIRDNLLNCVENRGKTAIISCRTLRICLWYIRHIHISTENTARLLIDLLPNIRYTNEAPMRESRFRFPERQGLTSTDNKVARGFPGNNRTYVL